LLPFLLVLLPLLGAGAAYVIVDAARRSRLLLVTAAAHLAMVAALWRWPAQSALGGWLAPDAIGLVILSLESLLFAAVATYAVGALRLEKQRGGRVFVSGLLVFLGATSLVSLSQHLALLWIGLEATTLAVAPLIFHRRDRRSLEAVWKYLVLSSVGIAFVLLAVFLLATAQSQAPGQRPLMLADLRAGATALDPSWLRTSFVFALIGLGTKMGLAPLHTWKPDTYGEAPELVGALMSGGLTACAFLGLARFSEIAAAAGLLPFTRPLLISFGLLSLFVAAAFMIGQADVKRMLAYSSVEHMGLLVIGLAGGSVGSYGSVLHTLNNGLIKGALFLAVGNLVRAAGSPVVAEMRNLLARRPISATLLVTALFAVSGAPPFGLFTSEYAIFRGMIEAHQLWLAILVALALAIAFVGIAAMLLEIVFAGDRPAAAQPRKERSESAWLVAGPAVLTGLVLMLGFYLPAPLRDALDHAAASLAGHGP
jgi:hydrogenase-4 component F